MATPRASGFWETDTQMSRSDSARDYFTEDDQEESLLEGEEVFDGRTPLDRTIDRIGMGSYQWTLLSLCGLGWMADNMWIQAIAIVLPRVQRHYDVPDAYIGAVSSSMFAGMMLGAVGWGTCSDLMGRITAFNATLFFTAVFGILASLSNSFFTLCVALFFLGSSVGGSMPTDGTLLLEHMPKSKQYLVTALSVFFSVGAVLAAVIGLLVIPQHSCLSGSDVPCDPAKDNLGWKYLLIILASLTLFMFLARMVFFRLHESPRYLVSAGRPQDAIKSLQLISRFNGSEMEVELDDVRDHHHPEEQAALQASLSSSPPLKLSSPPPPQRATSRTVLFDAVGDLESGSGGSSRSGSRGSNEPAYNAVGESQALRSSPTEATSQEEYPPNTRPMSTVSVSEPTDEDGVPIVATPRRPRPPRLRRQSSAASRRSRASVYEQKFFWSLPHAVRKPLWAWWDRVMSVLDPEWRRTTLLVWGAWWSMSLASRDWCSS